MHAIFNPPMTANGGGKALHLPGKTEQVIACLGRYLKTNPPFRYYHANGLQALPSSFLIQVGELLKIVNHPMFPDF